MDNSVRTFHARAVDIQAVEVAVIADGKPTDEHAFVTIPGGTLMDAATFLALYREAGQPVVDSGPVEAPKKKRGRPPGSGKKQKAVARKVARPAKPARPASVLAAEFRPPVAKPRAGTGGAPTLAGMIRTALGGGPKDLSGIQAHVNSGPLTIEDHLIANALYQMKYMKYVTRDEAGLYSLANGNGARA